MLKTYGHGLECIYLKDNFIRLCGQTRNETRNTRGFLDKSNGTF